MLISLNFKCFLKNLTLKKLMDDDGAERYVNFRLNAQVLFEMSLHKYIR